MQTSGKKVNLFNFFLALWVFLNSKMVLILIIAPNSNYQVPKLSDGQHNAENQRSLPDVVGTKKQVSYKTEIIGGVPIVTQTQVKGICGFTHVKY